LRTYFYSLLSLEANGLVTYNCRQNSSLHLNYYCYWGKYFICVTGNFEKSTDAL